MSRKKPVSPRFKVTVEIAGEKHVLRSDVPPEYTRAVADYLDSVVRSLPGAGSLEPHRALVLAALSITDELFRAREATRGAHDDARRRAAALADALEQATVEAFDAGIEEDEPDDDGEGDDAGPVDRDGADGDASRGVVGDDGASDALGADEEDEPGANRWEPYRGG